MERNRRALIMYKKMKNDLTDSDYTTQIQRKADNAVIPFDPANTDYQEYLEWVAAGNTPEAAD